jgi:hypothetical protein
MLAYIGLEMAWNGHYGMSLDRCGLWDIVLHWLSLDILRQGTVGIAEQLFSTKARGSVDQYVIHSMHLWYITFRLGVRWGRRTEHGRGGGEGRREGGTEPERDQKGNTHSSRHTIFDRLHTVYRVQAPTIYIFTQLRIQVSGL